MTSAPETRADQTPSPVPVQRSSTTRAQLYYDRRISVALRDMLAGPLAGIVAWRDANRVLRDVQLRREPKGQRCWAALYVGLTSVLDIEERAGSFRLYAAETHRKAGGFDESWLRLSSGEEIERFWPSVLAYLARVEGRVHPRWKDSEGKVHALLANADNLGFRVVDREASIGFLDTETRARLIAAWRESMLEALRSASDGGQWWAHVLETPFGTSPDFLAVDEAGRLLVIEAKPASATAGIVRAPAQVGLYAAMFAAWVSQHPDTAVHVLKGELAQRRSLGLLPLHTRRTLARPIEVVPVLAVGPGSVSPEGWSRCRTVATAVNTAPSPLPVAPLEILLLGQEESTRRW